MIYRRDTICNYFAKIEIKSTAEIAAEDASIA